MAEVLVIEFTAPNAVEIYNNVNHHLGWDGAPTPEQWPAGMLSHVSGELGDKLIVVEVWQSKADQEAFLHAQLGPAFEALNIPQPARMEWFSNVADIHRH